MVLVRCTRSQEGVAYSITGQGAVQVTAGAGTTHSVTGAGAAKVRAGAGATHPIRTGGAGGSRRVVMSVITGVGATYSIMGLRAGVDVDRLMGASNPPRTCGLRGVRGVAIVGVGGRGTKHGDCKGQTQKATQGKGWV